MEAVCSCETSVATQQTTRRHIPEDDTLKLFVCFKNFKTGCLYNNISFCSKLVITTGKCDKLRCLKFIDELCVQTNGEREGGADLFHLQIDGLS
jgi:hypothetical protein